jgi:DNA polymerase-1
MLLLLVDGTNLARRVYEAVPEPDGPSRGERALRSCLSSVQRALREHSPTHAAVVFDHDGPTFRHRLYPAYKANRHPAPEAFQAMQPPLQRGLHEAGLQTLSLPDVEADDVLASLVCACPQVPVVVLSTDKDLCQLASERVRIRDHFQRHWRDERWVRERYGVAAHQLGDALALVGDATDNVPGCPDIGPKTAARLLEQFGSLDALLANVDRVPARAGERLRAHLQDIRLSRALVALRDDLALPVALPDLERLRDPASLGPDLHRA